MRAFLHPAAGVLAAALVCRAVMARGQTADEPRDPPPTPIVSVRAPLTAPPFLPLPLGSVRPLGWLLTQCRLQRDGLTGAAEQIYAGDLGTNSGWLGGTGENWERGPYYLKGLVALAYTMDDPALKERAQKWLDWLLEHQRADGSIGPVANDDWWPRMPATYALRDYYEATADPRVPAALGRYFHYMLANLPHRPLKDWGRARAADEMEVVLWLYNLKGDPSLLDLAGLLRRQSYDWTRIYAGNRFALSGTDFQTKHNVNVEQALKFPAVSHLLSDDPDDFRSLELGWDHLMSEHGLACGINSGTEFLSGNASVQGVELCAIVEAMLSLETDARATGDPVFADRLETIAFNALPAALARDIKAIQYYTLPNNVIAIAGGHGYNQDYSNGSLPGPDSGYPCCRYNFHMGWPKYVQNSWAATPDDGLALLAYGPTEVTARRAGQPVRITEQTGYPFADRVTLVINTAAPAAFPLVLRVPGWCAAAAVAVNGQPQPGIRPGSFLRLDRTWRAGDRVTLRLPMPIQTRRGPSRSLAINRGPLVYSLRVGQQWTVRTPDPLGRGFDEYELHATTPWNYALQVAETNPAESFEVRQFALPENPFDPARPPVELIAQARRLPDWTLGWRGTHAFEPPVSPVASAAPLEPVTLAPFGSQQLRVSWFPILGVPSPVAGWFRENFDPGWSSRWTVFGGNWTAREGVLATVPGSANGAKALAMATDFTNFTYTADVSVGAAGDAGLLFRASRPDIGADDYCGYYAGISAQNARLEFGCASNAWREIASAPLAVAPGSMHRLKIEARGARFQIFVDGGARPVLQAEDGRFAHGMVGVRDYCGDADRSLSSFTRLQVAELPGATAGGQP